MLIPNYQNGVYMRLIFISIFVLVFLSACAYRITDIDVSNKEPTCVRECTANYSSSVSQGNQIGFKTETLRASKDAYSICISTCPNK